MSHLPRSSVTAVVGFPCLEGVIVTRALDTAAPEESTTKPPTWPGATRPARLRSAWSCAVLTGGLALVKYAESAAGADLLSASRSKFASGVAGTGAAPATSTGSDGAGTRPFKGTSFVCCFANAGGAGAG